ncbi:membrane protein [Gordonia phage Hello]|uniref:Membrane protein n=1 Tax=Gordonia phage Hello TaxID=2510573 RepID=A0A411B4M9_9CAUD|nr:membrane protein [Gordonia phage Hello]
MGWRFRPLEDSSPAVPDKVESMKLYLAIESYALSAFAIYYGLLTYRFGESLWPPGRSALSVPYAPQSWGTAMIVLAILTMIVSHRRIRWSKYVSLTMKLMCLVWGVFSATFVIDIVFHNAGPNAYPPMGVYLLLAVACANRSSLEDQWRA